MTPAGAMAHMAELEEQILDYLRTHNTMTLGTCVDGVPWNATGLLCQ